MKACLLLFASLALISQGQKMEPVTCDYSKGEMMCSGEWSLDWKEQISPDYCIPDKVGDCANFCPMKCGEGDMVCPGKIGPDGCKMADFCNHGSRSLDSFSGN